MDVLITMASATTHILINSVSSIVYVGMGIWEAVVASMTGTPSRDVNDMARCFIITMSVFNLTIGTIMTLFTLRSWYTESGEQVSFNVSTGVSIWGLILYFRFSEFCEVIITYILLAETILFFARILGILCLFCVEHTRPVFPIEIHMEE